MMATRSSPVAIAVRQWRGSEGHCLHPIAWMTRPVQTNCPAFGEAYELCGTGQTFSKLMCNLFDSTLRLAMNGRWVDRQQAGGAVAADHQHTHERDAEMNWDRIEGDWKQFKGNIKTRWGKLTDDQLDVIAGQRDVLAGKIQEAYGISKDEAEKQLDEWQERQKETTRRQ
jgi:uncharacterized protein YjbJ (UPF0337 family)